MLTPPLKGAAPVSILYLALLVFSREGILATLIFGILLLLWLIFWLPFSAIRLFRVASAQVYRLEKSEYERGAFGVWLGAFLSAFLAAALFPFAGFLLLSATVI